MDAIQIENVLAELQKKQPIFHSEADFLSSLPPVCRLPS